MMDYHQWFVLGTNGDNRPRFTKTGAAVRCWAPYSTPASQENNLRSSGGGKLTLMTSPLWPEAVQDAGAIAATQHWTNATRMQLVKSSAEGIVWQQPIVILGTPTSSSLELSPSQFVSA